MTADPASDARPCGTDGGAALPNVLRVPIRESWERSLAAGVDPEHQVPPLVLGRRALLAARADHPLAAVLPILRSTLAGIADDAEHLMVVTDAAGIVLWREGATPVKRRADRAGLSEGARWRESDMGTNAIGTALATGLTVQVQSGEHFVRAGRDWTCAAAPIHDPDTGALLGVIDVSGPPHTAHPAMPALVSAAAQLAEGHLRTRLTSAEEQPPWLGFPSPVDRGEPPKLVLRFLDDGPASATVDGRTLRLTLKHAEILTLLALHPRGLTAEQLALLLYGDAGNPVTVRTEIHRLRRLLGPQAVHTRPYRLIADLDADFLHVHAAMNGGERTDAVHTFHGPLLPASDAPGVRQERTSLTALVRRIVLDGDNADALWSFYDTSCGADDQQVVAALRRLLGGHDPRRARLAQRSALGHHHGAAPSVPP